MVSHSSGLRVLVAEDDYLVSEMVHGLLDGIGATCIATVRHGAQALEATKAFKPDVVIMDIAMPGMDGLEATKRIQENCPTPVVILTAYDSPDLVERASSVGVGAYVVKPANGFELDRAIAIALARFPDMVRLRALQAELEAHQQNLADARRQLRRLRSLLPSGVEAGSGPIGSSSRFSLSSSASTSAAEA